MKFYSDDRVDLYGGDSLAVLASLPTEHQPGAHRRMLTYVRTDVDVPLAVAS